MSDTIRECPKCKLLSANSAELLSNPPQYQCLICFEYSPCNHWREYYFTPEGEARSIDHVDNYLRGYGNYE